MMSHQPSTVRHAAPLASRRGVTLIELLVTTAVMVVVLGIALGMMVESDRAMRRITRHQWAIQYCQQTLSQVSDTIRSAVPPANLPALKNQEAIAPRFQEHELSVALLSNDERPYLCQVTIGVDREKRLIRREISPNAETAGDRIVQNRTEELGGLKPEHFTPQIKFAYAAAPKMPGEADYVPTWSAQNWPALIRVTVQAKVDGDSEHPIELQTAVIPGLMPESARPAAAKAPAAAETKTTQTLKTGAPAPAPPASAGKTSPAAATDAKTSPSTNPPRPAEKKPAAEMKIKTETKKEARG